MEKKEASFIMENILNDTARSFMIRDVDGAYFLLLLWTRR